MDINIMNRTFDGIAPSDINPNKIEVINQDQDLRKSVELDDKVNKTR